MSSVPANWPAQYGYAGDLNLRDGEYQRPFIIGVTGGTASGKTTVCETIVKRLGFAREHVTLLSQDSYYRPLTPDEKKMAFAAQYNFDAPNAFDFDLFEKQLSDLVHGRAVDVPTYSFTQHSRLPETVHVQPTRVILIEGILTLYTPTLRALMDMKLFVDTDDDLRLMRRIRRDIRERGRDLENVLHQYEQHVKPSFEEFTLPTKRYADIIIPRGGGNDVAIDVIVQHIKAKLDDMRTEEGTY